MNMAFTLAGYVSGLNGPSEYPNTAAGVRIKQTLNDQWSIKLGLLDGEADSPDAKNTTGFLFKSQYGVLGIGEVDYTPVASTKLMAGVWGLTGQLDKLGQFSSSFAQLKAWGDVGGYVGGATRLYTIEGACGLDGFFNVGFTNGVTNVVSNSYEGGVSFTGLIDSRPKDKLGFAVSVDENSSGFRALQLLD
jgi:carbohydrate-selective porin OprB